MQNGETPDSADTFSDQDVVLKNNCEIEKYYKSLWAFTLCPDPKRYPSYDAEAQYHTIIQTLLQKPFMRNTFNTFEFYPELTQEGNIHLHGYFSVKDRIKYFKVFLPLCKKIGFIKLKANVDEHWIDYCRKDVDMMEELLYPLPVPYNEYSHRYYEERAKYHFPLSAPRRKKRKTISDYFNNK